MMKAFPSTESPTNPARQVNKNVPLSAASALSVSLALIKALNILAYSKPKQRRAKEHQPFGPCQHPRRGTPHHKPHVTKLREVPKEGQGAGWGTSVTCDAEKVLEWPQVRQGVTTSL